MEIVLEVAGCQWDDSSACDNRSCQRAQNLFNDKDEWLLLRITISKNFHLLVDVLFSGVAQFFRRSLTDEQQ